MAGKRICLIYKGVLYCGRMQQEFDQQVPGKESVEDYSGRIFWFALGLVPIFGLPAILAVFAGRYVENTYDISWPVTLVFLGLAFVFSWAVVIRQYIIFNKQWKARRPDTKY